MEVIRLKKQRKNNAISKNTYAGVLNYGQNNDYPQQAEDVINGSITGHSCLRVYENFFRGICKDERWSLIAHDFTMFGGVCLLVKRDFFSPDKVRLLGTIPFDLCRLRYDDKNYKITGVSVHADWGKRYINIEPFDLKNAENFDFYDSKKERSWESAEDLRTKVTLYKADKGEVVYLTNSNKIKYPLPIYDSVLTEMSTEQGLSNVMYKNVRCNFLTSGALIDYYAPTNDETAEALRDFQGDENASSLLYVKATSKEEKPDFVSFSGENYDGKFAKTEDTLKDRIGRAFNQPPILRCEDVGAGFGADLLDNAYKYYNSIVEGERVWLINKINSVIGVNFDVKNLKYDYNI